MHLLCVFIDDSLWEGSLLCLVFGLLISFFLTILNLFLSKLETGGLFFCFALLGDIQITLNSNLKHFLVKVKISFFDKVFNPIILARILKLFIFYESGDAHSMSVESCLSLRKYSLLQSNGIVSLHLVVRCFPILHNGRTLPSLTELIFKFNLFIQTFLDSRFVCWKLLVSTLMNIIIVDSSHKLGIVEWLITSFLLKFGNRRVINTLLINLLSFVRLDEHFFSQLVIVFNSALSFLIHLFTLLDLLSNVILNHYLFLFLSLKVSVKVLLVILLELFAVKLPCPILLVKIKSCLP